MAGGHLYGEKQPTEQCPYCGSECHAEFVDVGVGFTQVSPYHCDNCMATEIGPYDKLERPLEADEKRTGWYAPQGPLPESVPMLNGKVVSAGELEAAYREEFANNPLYHVDGVVEAWFAKHRRPQGQSEEVQST